jgi:hypothetical protein
MNVDYLATGLPEWDLVRDSDGDPLGIDLHGHVDPRVVDQVMVLLDQDGASWFDSALDFRDSTGWLVTRVWRTEHPVCDDPASPDFEGVELSCWYSYTNKPVAGGLAVTRFEMDTPPTFWCWNHPFEPWETMINVTTTDLTMVEVGEHLARQAEAVDPRLAVRHDHMRGCWGEPPRDKYWVALCRECREMVDERRESALAAWRAGQGASLN